MYQLASPVTEWGRVRLTVHLPGLVVNKNVVQ